MTKMSSNKNYPTSLIIWENTITTTKIQQFPGNYHICSSVKGTNMFWRVQGIIDSVNKMSRKNASGVKNTADILMSAICFCNTPKDDLPHYLFISRKTEPLVTELKICYVLG